MWSRTCWIRVYEKDLRLMQPPHSAILPETHIRCGECLYIEALCQIYYYQKSQEDFIFPKRYIFILLPELPADFRTIKGDEMVFDINSLLREADDDIILKILDTSLAEDHLIL